MPEITNQSGKYEFKYLNSLEYYFTKKTNLMVFLYQYIFNYNIFLDMTYINTFVYVWSRYWSPFYMGFYP